ncbi:MAG: phosphotransferase [Ardenticatenales bacterium]|nr:phosphotransferase [Ardenticatenales bacterium]
MTENQLPLPVALARKRVGAIKDWWLLSRSNSLLWQVETESGRFVIKHLADRSSDPLMEQRIGEWLTPDPLFRPIRWVESCADGTFVVISDFIPGVSLDQVLETNAYTPAEAIRWGGQMHEMFVRLGELPAQSFGQPDINGTGEAASWGAFWDSYLMRQRQKAPQLAALRFDALYNAFKRIQRRLDHEIAQPRLIPADVNSRNFLVTDPRRNLVFVNVPLVWHGDAAHPYGESLVHLDQTPLLETLLSLAAYPAWRLHLYAALNAYVILAYVERFGGQPVHLATPWGRKRPLLNLLDWHLEQVSVSLP